MERELFIINRNEGTEVFIFDPKSNSAVIRLGREIKICDEALIPKIKEVTKWGKRLKWLRPLMIGIEVIPIIGSAPCWIVAVYLELKHG